MQTVVTEIIPPTNTKSARIKAICNVATETYTVAYLELQIPTEDGATRADLQLPCHQKAAELLLGKTVDYLYSLDTHELPHQMGFVHIIRPVAQ